ncbi:uncharacterized protein PHACADRAFT_247969 [Phanerochaete carnosa HHB-10118-sp]|uniref:Uncharacterized protein n=1 Tax=Phanerochaete carnosa (strain HHB-10118-sp) TaxID=650164 RepID=K5WQA4_PHACS|nr:uncharacterized protein PHACADRAFT_247969 [Phanerochaete carnosa HHB-10118-sp]EKM61404.1 hypothetical protein PHACADRAFT_247969 [Phanerochaete carnosa HHB-10118-sp]
MSCLAKDFSQSLMTSSLGGLMRTRLELAPKPSPRSTMIGESTTCWKIVAWLPKS